MINKIPIAYGSIGDREDVMPESVEQLKEEIKILKNLLLETRNMVLKGTSSEEWSEEWLKKVNRAIYKC